MAKLTQISGPAKCLLEGEHIVGRSRRSSLQIEDSRVSAQHALIRWTGQSWEVKDLGSANGTFVEGGLIKPGQPVVLRRGFVLRFGTDRQDWLFDDDGAPQVMAIPVGGAGAIQMEGGILALPSNDDPQVTIYRGGEGTWVLEKEDIGLIAIRNLDTFEIAGQAWRFHCPDVADRTAQSETQMKVEDLRLHFGVSSDEEHVELRADSGGRQIDMGGRGHNYLLLTLARQRLEDRAAGVPETSSGWIYQEELLRGLDEEPSQLGVAVFRIREQFSSIGVVDAARVIERRPRTKQIRIGVTALTITRL